MLVEGLGVWDSLGFSTAVQDFFTEIEGAAHRDKSRECGRLKAKVEPLLT